MPYEIEDQAFFPSMLRRQQMEAISFMVQLMQTYKPLVPWVQRILKQQPAWTDGCTGAAGPVIYLLQQGCMPQQLILADRYMLVEKTRVPHSNYRLLQTDVQQEIPGNGFVTMFNAFHHFSPDAQKQFLEKAASQKRPLLIAEITRPGLINFVSITLAATLLQVLVAPFIKPFRWSRLLCTYIIPLNIITVLWDGWMSVFFGMRRSRFRKLESYSTNSGYAFTFKTYGPFWQKIYCLHGEPTET